MQKTRKYFSQDFLIQKVRNSIKNSKLLFFNHSNKMSDLDCLMSALAMFSLKFPSMLSFNKHYTENEGLARNLRHLFGTNVIPSDTRMRERLDLLSPESLRGSFTNIFALLQRGHILDKFQFYQSHYLISIDGTGYFSSSSIHCEQCCVKEHRSGEKTYYHQMLSAALVHPKEKIVYPFAPEPILKQDGNSKNDCERNAAKRWLAGFRREHPHLKVIIIADGLSANEPYIELLKQYNMHYILVCRDGDHKYLTDWINVAYSTDAPSFIIKNGKITEKYQYMNDVPLNSSEMLKVNVLRYWETKDGITRKWVWITDFKISKENARTIMQGGRTRWRIENETLNTLKNQGYNFEHNYGHGYKHLSVILAFLMMLAFFIDQVLQDVNNNFKAALEHCGSKRSLWESMRTYFILYIIPLFENLYKAILHPPPPIVLGL